MITSIVPLASRAIFNTAGIGLWLAVTLSLAVTGSVSQAQNPPTIAILETMTLDAVQARTTAFRRHLQALGYTDGHNIRTIVLNAEGEQKRGEALISTAMRDNPPDLIVTNATLASRAVKKLLAGSDIPQVFMLVGDPIGAGLVPAIGKPSGTNITGTTHLLPARQKVELLNNVMRSQNRKAPLRVALLHSTYPSAISDFNEITAAGKDTADVTFSGVRIDYTPNSGATYQESVRGMARAAIAKLKDEAGNFDVYWVCNGPNAINKAFLSALRDEVAKPMIYANSLAGVKVGGMFTVFSSADTNGLDTARMVDAILKGENAADIPVARPNTFNIAINVTTAEKLGIVIPVEILELAGDSIFR